MGSSYSHSEENFSQLHHAHSSLPHQKNMNFEKHSSTIFKESFLSKFDPNLHNLGQIIWDCYTKENFLTFDEHQQMIIEFDSTKPKIAYFVKLFRQDNLTKSDIEQLFGWLTLGRNLSSIIWELIFNSLLPNSDENGFYNKESIIKSLNTKCPDLGEDLHTVVKQIINNNLENSIDFNQFGIDYEQLLDSSLYWLFSIILSFPYKKMSSTCLNNSAPLEIEQLSHWHCLFSSHKHGLSSTRILEMTFNYNGPMILLFKAQNYLFCLTTDQGLKESWKTFGGESSVLYQIYPKFIKLVSGVSSKSDNTETGIIYANFSAKTAKRGLLIGHQPLSLPVIEIFEGFDQLSYNGSLPMKINAVEIWATGSDHELSQLKCQKEWEAKQVMKAKDRKIKMDDWKDSADRQILSMAGVDVHHSEVVENM